MTNILAIDRGKKKIGLAWKSSIIDIAFPIGYIIGESEERSSSVLIGDILNVVDEKKIGRIVVGIPRLGSSSSSSQIRVCEQITQFFQQLQQLLPPTVSCEYVDEHYSSVEAGSTLGDYHKHVGEDVVAAMRLLERVK